jgi:molybdate transport repressor ModE-like protein
VLDLRRLWVLQAVARHGSLSAAGRELGYSQPAVSHHIARLEDELGTALVTRIGRGTVLTDAGRALAAHADIVLRDVMAAEEDVAAIAGLHAGRVRLAAFPSAGAMLAPPVLAELTREHPGVKATFLEAEPEEALPLLRSGDLDVVIGFRYPEAAGQDGDDFEYLPLLRDPLHVVLPAGHRLAGADAVRLGELADERWIAGCERCRQHLLHCCAEAGFAPEIAMATDDYVTVQALIAAGQGAGLLSGLMLASHRRDDIAVRPLAEGVARSIEAVVPRASRRPPAVTATLTALGGVSDALASGTWAHLGLARSEA